MKKKEEFSTLQKTHDILIKDIKKFVEIVDKEVKGDVRYTIA